MTNKTVLTLFIWISKRPLKQIHISISFPKLKKYHFSNCTVNWISSLLTSRKHRPVVNRVPSSWSKVVSSVPQGSMLGPVLFLNFINDLPSYVECFVKLFADYTKLYFTANFPMLLVLWSMQRSAVIRYGNSNSHNQYTLKALDGSNSIIKEVLNECDLGITFDSKLLSKEHIAHIVSKAKILIGMIK